jgi:hypothetical protein
MKKYLMTTAIVGCLAAVPAAADPTVMFGLSWTFGGAQSGQLGISGRILSDNRADTFVVGAGVTYYLGSQEFGIDAGIGYNVGNTPIVLSYDFINENMLLSAGWADMY